MNEEIKQRWISKLTSGEYSQTSGKLNDSDGYCCLGVLCEIAVEDGIVFKEADEGYTYYTSKLDEKDSNSHVLPFSVVDWAGLPDINPDVTLFDEDPDEDPCKISDLASLNDSGKSFSYLAQVIEKNF